MSACPTDLSAPIIKNHTVYVKEIITIIYGTPTSHKISLFNMQTNTTELRKNWTWIRVSGLKIAHN